MRNFHGLASIQENEKPRRQQARRITRRFMIALKRSLILAGCAGAVALLIGCQEPPCTVGGQPASGADCMVDLSPCTDREREGGYRYGVNDACYDPAIMRACETLLDRAVTPTDKARAYQFCGIR